MRLEGIHHVTCITGDAPRNVEFYAGTLGLRLVKKSVNQDDPTVYHLFYADEAGDPGSDITFFEYPGAARGRAGRGMVHTIVWRVASPAALEFWQERLREAGSEPERRGDRLRFGDPEGLAQELVVAHVPDPPLVAEHPEIPHEHAIQGFDAVRAYATAAPSLRLLEEGLGFERIGDDVWNVRGATRGSLYVYDPPPAEPGIAGAGTVHHVAWAAPMEEHAAWRERAARAGAHPTPVIDRYYFHSIYFREPSGVLFEIASIGPGFAVDEPPEHLGESLALPPNFEHLRERLDGVLTPLPDLKAVRGR